MSIFCEPRDATSRAVPPEAPTAIALAAQNEAPQPLPPPLGQGPQICSRLNRAEHPESVLQVMRVLDSYPLLVKLAIESIMIGGQAWR